MVQPFTNSQPAVPQPQVTTAPPALSTVGELRADGHAYRTVKEEIRQNLLARMSAPCWPGTT
jgi:magnesium chelatase subunit I